MTPYACHSKPRKDGYWAGDGLAIVESNCEGINLVWWGLAKWIPDTMTKECQYRKTTPDERCKGCTCP